MSFTGIFARTKNCCEKSRSVIFFWPALTELLQLKTRAMELIAGIRKHSQRRATNWAPDTFLLPKCRLFVGTPARQFSKKLFSGEGFPGRAQKCSTHRLTRRPAHFYSARHPIR
jgi:hypothetical protein